MRFQLTPLRTRVEDIPLLVDHFLEKYNRLYNRNVERFSERAMYSLTDYSWPGNVRELENVVNQAVLLSDGGVIEVEDLQRKQFLGHHGESAAVDFANVTSLKESVSSVVAAHERQIIGHFLRKNNYNKSRTATQLSLTRKTLAQKIQKYGLDTG
jgi:DNA-binding NtrC family response regulator